MLLTGSFLEKIHFLKPKVNKGNNDKLNVIYLPWLRRILTKKITVSDSAKRIARSIKKKRL